MIKAIIIDDLETARENLKADIKSYCPEIDILGEANSVVSGIKLVKNTQADLLFLDVSLGDGTGFDVLEIIGETNLKVIFTTASGEHAVKAFRFSAIDYLLKPIDPDELINAVSKAKKTSKDQIDTLKNNLLETNKIVLHTSDRIYAIEINDIVRCESQINYTQFFLKDGSKILVSKTLKEFDALLKDKGFLRVHQSHLIQIKAVKSFIKNKHKIILTDGNEVPVSTRKKTDVLQALSN